MCAFGQPAHHIFGADDGHRKAFGVAVDGRAQHEAAGFQKVAAGSEVGGGVGHMLDHFHVQDGVELKALGSQCFGGCVAVIDGQLGLFGVQFCDGNIAFGRICARDRGAQPGHWLGQEAATAPNVENFEAGEWEICVQVAVKLFGDLRCDIIQPARVEHVQGFEFASRIPPFVGHPLKFLDLVAVDCTVEVGHQKAFGGCSWHFLPMRGYIIRCMDKTSGHKSAAQLLYPPISPFDQRMLDVGDGHRVYVEQCGNPNGVPVVVLHGGPGGGCSPAMRRYFDPAIYRIVLFDQRGCGRSRPHASVEANTTWHLVADIELIRLALGIDRWAVFGGSWGAALALIYAQAHPSSALHLILRGVFLMSERELDWFYGGGAGRFWPENWARFVQLVPEAERSDMIAAYNARLFSNDAAVETRFARAWTSWENALASIDSSGVAGESPAEYARAFARLENHYFSHGGWLGEDHQILDNMDRLRDVPGTIVQGRFDMICPPEAAYALHQAWPGSDLRMIGKAGHALSEPGITAELVRIMRRLASALKRETGL